MYRITTRIEKVPICIIDLTGDSDEEAENNESMDISKFDIISDSEENTTDSDDETMNDKANTDTSSEPEGRENVDNSTN